MLSSENEESKQVDVSAIEPDEIKITPQPIRILFGGDMMFDRDIRLVLEKNGDDFVFSELSDFLHTYDFVVANLEGTITKNKSVSVHTTAEQPSHFQFTFDPGVASMIAKHNISLVSVANNHTDDFGEKGIYETKQYLQDASVNYFGYSGYEKESSDRVFTKLDITPSLAFVGYNQFAENGFSIAIDDIAYAQNQADIVIVMPHWGAEYLSEAQQPIVDEAHALIDAGADLIIGAHPHVIQQRELYEGKTIYYSLGNFVFDQYFEPIVRKGLLVEVQISNDGALSFTEFNISLDRTGKTMLMDDPTDR